MGAADHQEGMKGKHKHKNFQHAFALLLSSPLPFLHSFPPFSHSPHSPPILHLLWSPFVALHHFLTLYSTPCITNCTFFSRQLFYLRCSTSPWLPLYTLLSLLVHQHPQSPPGNFVLESYCVVRMAWCTVVLLSVVTTRPAYKTTHVGIRIAVPLYSNRVCLPSNQTSLASN